MAAGILNYKILLEADASELAELEKKLLENIKATKEAGGNFSELERQLAVVQSRINGLDGATHQLTGGTQQLTAKQLAGIGVTKGMHQANASLAALMSGNLVSGFAMAGKAFGTLKVAFAANPVGALWFAVDLLGRGLTALVAKMEDARKKAEELNRAKFEEFKSSLELSKKSLEDLDKIRLDSAKAQIDGLIDRQKKYQDEIDRTLAKQLRLADDKFQAEAAELDFRRQQELGKAATPEKKESVNLKYQGLELELRQRRDRAAAEARLAAASGRVAASDRNVAIATDAATMTRDRWQQRQRELTSANYRAGQLSYVDKDGRRQTVAPDAKGMTAYNATFSRVIEAINAKPKHTDEDQNVLKVLAQLSAAQSAELNARSQYQAADTNRQKVIDTENLQRTELAAEQRAAESFLERLDKVIQPAESQKQKNAERDFVKQQGGYVGLKLMDEGKILGDALDPNAIAQAVGKVLDMPVGNSVDARPVDDSLSRPVSHPGAADQFSRIGWFIGGGGPSLDYNRRTAAASESLLKTTMRIADKLAQPDPTGGALWA